MSVDDRTSGMPAFRSYSSAVLTRRRILPIAALLTLFALPGSASAAQAVLDGQGVTATKSGSRVTFHFADTKQGRAAFKQVAGRTIEVECAPAPKPSPPIGVTVRGSSGTEVRVGRRRGPVSVRFFANEPVDWCSLTRNTKKMKNDTVALVGVTDAGRTYLDEVFTAASLEFVDIFAEKDTSVAAVVAAGKGLIVALDGPEGVPPHGRVGYWTDGTTFVRAAVTKAGRRLFAETRGDVVRTNALGLIAGLDDAD